MNSSNYMIYQQSRLSVWFFLLFAVLFITGCTDLRDPVIDPRPSDLPSKFSLYSSAPAPEVPWWNHFESAELADLIQEGIKESPDIEETWSRLTQARAVAVKEGAKLYPELTGRAGAAHIRNRSEGEGERSSDDFHAGFMADYELDLWGRVRADRESATLAAASSREDLNSAIIILSSKIGEAWVQQIAARQKEKQLEKQLDLNRKLLSLIETRFSLARAGALDVYQQGQTVASIEGGLIKIRAQQAILSHQLSLLTGQWATSPPQLKETDFPRLPSVPAIGLPADLLARRPDIRSVGLRLKAADWEIAAAKADRLPRITLGASFSYESNILGQLLDNWLLRLSSNLVGPVFDGGKRQAEVMRARAVADERLASYKKMVLIAIREVEDSLSRENEYQLFSENIELQIDLTDKALREATWRYLNGLNDFLPVLREQVNLITLQLDHIQARSDLVQARIALYRALGGSWPASLSQSDYSGKP